LSEKRGLAIGCRQTFDTTICQRLNNSGLDFTSYFKHKEPLLHDIPCLVIQLESLWKIGEQFVGKTIPVAKYDYLILDEAVTIRKQFFSETMAKVRKECFSAFKHLLSTMPRIYILDSDLDQACINFFCQFRPKRDFKIIHNTSLPEERTAQVLSIDNFFHTMRDMRKKGLKTAFISYSPQPLIDEEVKIKEEGSTYAIYHSGVSAKKKQQDFTNVDNVWSHVQNVLYSPTCTVGTSYKGKDFDYIFILAG